jgi:hypothetical protein
MKYRFTDECAIARSSVAAAAAAAADSPRSAIVSRHPGIPSRRREDGTLSRPLVDRLSGRSVDRPARCRFQLVPRLDVVLINIAR